MLQVEDAEFVGDKGLTISTALDCFVVVVCHDQVRLQVSQGFVVEIAKRTN